MERDFMGLVVVKQECFEDAIDAAPLRSSTMQWSLSNKSCAVPQMSSYHRPMTGFDSLASTGLVTITTTETFDSKNNFPENQGGLRYRMTTYPTKHPSGQNLIVQPISAVPMPNPVVGTTDLRNTHKMTIFYNGSVCVYDNISAEKAQAIMLLAGNGHPTTPSPSATIPAAPLQASVPNKPSIRESFVANRPYATTTTPHRSSPVASNSAPQSLGWSGSIKTTAAPKQCSSSRIEPQKVVNLPGSVSATFLPSSTVPQFRRKSLARFLEKRKERVISTTPYANKESPDCNSSGSCPVQAVN